MKLVPAVTAMLLFTPGVMADSTAIPPKSLPLNEILQRMDQHDRAMSESLTGYTCLRRYALENHRFHKTAELRVRMTYSSPGHKKFEVLSEAGAPVLRRRVLLPMLEAEEEAGRDDVRPQTRIVMANYDFQLIGSDIQQGRKAYQLDITPKTRNKFLIRGRVWVDAIDFGIIRVDASPAQNPSVFIHNTHVQEQSTRFGGYWLPLFNHSNTDSFLFGRTEVTIDSWDYKITTTPVESQNRLARLVPGKAGNGPLKAESALGYTTSTPILRAVPFTERTAASRSKQFRSGILILAISSTCWAVILPTFVLCGSGEPLARFTARLMSTGTGGVLVMNVNERSE
jgi:hypothetical protein